MPTKPDSNETNYPRSVTFLPGSNTAILPVPAYSDGVEESGRDYLKATVKPPDTNEYRVGVPGTAEVEIFDSIPEVTVVADQDTINEDTIPDSEGTDVTFTLTRTDHVSQELTVTVRVDDPEMIRCFDHVFWRQYCPGWSDLRGRTSRSRSIQPRPP